MPVQCRPHRRPPTLARRLASVALLALLSSAGSAAAQTSGSIAMLSENSLRGYSLSDGHPAYQLRVDHDAATGWYAGGFLSTVSMPGSRARAQVVAYTGYARRTAGGMSWDVGASKTAFVREHRLDYVEAYAGVSLERASARLSLSPAYYGAGKTAYFEVNGFHPLGGQLRLIAHAGVLQRLDGDERRARRRLDLRLGLGADLGDVTLQASWLRRQRDPASRVRHAQALAASASIAF